ncbi:MAG: acyltransferase family protein [Actinoallomurus sp.]
MTGPAGWVARIAAGTSEQRDRTVDALRAVAILGVVFGHWLVSAVVADPYRPAALHGASPLSYEARLGPVSWFFQTLGPFFFAGGYAAARSVRGRRYPAWGVARLARLVPPVLVLAAVWLPALLLLSAVGAPRSTRQVVWSLVSHPLWFLLVYLILTALTPVLRAVVIRCGPWPVLAPVALVAVTDVVRGHGLPTWLELLTVLVGWAGPYLLGVALAEDRLPRRAGALLLPLGMTGAAALVLLAGYPASAVGVPGDGWSNLDPPSLFTLALAAAQLGAFLLLRPYLARWLRRPAVWAPVAALNLTAMTLYCWHQTALLLVTFAGLPAGRPRGLLDAPTGGWPAYRLLWLPVFALVLAGLCALFHRFERPRRGRPRVRTDRSCPVADKERSPLGERL